MGKVWLVGAGPWDAGLLTLKGKEVLSRAQVVVYDRLVGPGILSMIPENAECIDVGKQAGNHTMPQEEINQVLLREALADRRVVRLKGGDPFLFGRGGEELELLSRHGIPFEIVPGVPSAISVPAYNGIPVTHRDQVSSLHIITGHKKKGEPYDLDFDALVRTKGTLVFLMGSAALPEICKGLLNAGMDPDMPAALLQQGTMAGQKKLLSTVSLLASEAAKSTVATPAIILVGKVCSYGEAFGWYEKLPLFGKRILVTRPRERSGTLAGRLRELGGEVLEAPAISTVLTPDKEDLLRELERLGEYDWMAFTSPAGVNLFFDELREQKKDIRSIGRAKIAAIGPGTAKELEKRGLNVDAMPNIYDGQELGKLLGQVLQDKERLLIPRARKGNPQLIQEIRKQKEVEIVDLPIYDTVYGVLEHQGAVDVKAWCEKGDKVMAVFTSASTVRGFAACTQGMDYRLVQALCIGKQTRAQAEKLGMETFTSKEATIDSLVELAVEVSACSRKDGS
ncbi:MAG: uroporphyrinogen-III C-methyltransferase [Lachnospiraceae bacterium]|jgi:uroporphyrinogen III methyltransferase/synthase|nr:uroporphyrinogen-III C-methyltransferase [Lachnospiraceae bacterium]